MATHPPPTECSQCLSCMHGQVIHHDQLLPLSLAPVGGKNVCVRECVYVKGGGGQVYHDLLSPVPVWVQDLGFRVWGLGFGVWGLGFRV